MDVVETPTSEDHEPCSRRDAASVLLNPPGYRVVEAVDGPLGHGRWVVVSADPEGACPSGGVLTDRVHHGHVDNPGASMWRSSSAVSWPSRRFPTSSWTPLTAGSCRWAGGLPGGAVGDLRPPPGLMNASRAATAFGLCPLRRARRTAGQRSPLPVRTSMAMFTPPEGLHGSPRWFAWRKTSLLRPPRGHHR